MQMWEWHLINFYGHLGGQKEWTNKIQNHQRLLQNQYFEPLIENESETGVWNFPWNTHRVLKKFFKRVLWEGKSLGQTQSTLMGRKRLIATNSGRPHCLRKAGPQDSWGSKAGRVGRCGWGSGLCCFLHYSADSDNPYRSVTLQKEQLSRAANPNRRIHPQSFLGKMVCMPLSWSRGRGCSLSSGKYRKYRCP